MISGYFKELKEYSKEKLKKELGCDDSLLVGILEKLYDKSMIKVTNGKRVFPAAYIGKDDSLCKFNFVGLVVINGRVLKCYPKYLKEPEKDDFRTIKEDFRQVLEVIEEYHRSNKNPDLDDTGKSDSFNLLALMRWFLLDYYENGIYDNTREIIEINGTGEILWEKTVNETVAIISRGRPYYMDLLTKKRITDTYDYCKRLHEYILTKISKEMKEADILDLFRLTEVELTDEEREDFGDDEYILYRIEKELNAQFNTRKQRLLRNMYEYISEKNSLYNKNGFEVFGTNSFNLVWEAVCARIMENCLGKSLGELEKIGNFKLQNGKWDKSTKLSDLIGRVELWRDGSKRQWESDKEDFSDAEWKEEKSRLKPDLITIKNINGEKYFLIFDAKYYTPVIEGDKTTKLPGLGDITKQYLYQLAYQPFIRIHGFKAKNYFLMPAQENEVNLFGTFTLNMLKTVVKQMLGANLLRRMKKMEPNVKENEQLQDIQIRLLPARTAFECYLKNRPYEIESLKLLVNEGQTRRKN